MGPEAPERPYPAPDCVDGPEDNRYFTPASRAQKGLEAAP